MRTLFARRTWLFTGLVAAIVLCVARTAAPQFTPFPNDPHHLVRWVMTPQEMKPGTAMPDLGLSEQQARDVAAYLYTLQ